MLYIENYGGSHDLGPDDPLVTRVKFQELAFHKFRMFVVVKAMSSRPVASCWYIARSLKKLLQFDRL